MEDFLYVMNEFQGCRIKVSDYVNNKSAERGI